MKQGLLVISHGSRDRNWVKLVDEAIAEAEWPDGVPVASSFLECVPGRDIQAGIDALEALGVEQLCVVPLFVSSGSTHVDEIAWALGVHAEPLTETELERFRVKAAVRLGRPLDEHEAMLTMIADRLAELSVDRASGRVLLIAHGSPHEPFQARWRASLARIAERLVARGLCGTAGHSLLCCDDVPAAVRDLAAARVGSAPPMVSVVPLFLSEGYFTSQVIPKRLAEFMPSAAVTLSVEDQQIGSSDEPQVNIYDKPQVRYDGKPLLPHSALSDWLEEECRRLLYVYE